MRLANPVLLIALVACAACGDRTPPRAVAAPGVSSGIRFDSHILVDQFGYRPADPKVAVIRDPLQGYDREDRFQPGEAYEIRSVTDGTVVFSGHPEPWRAGEVEPSSGDRGWWFDFGSVQTPGAYFVYDAQKKVRSAVFNVRQDVYRPILKAALRMFFYQRSGMAKRQPFAAQCWIDDPAYVGPGQDTEALDVTDRDNKAKTRNLSGGWFDAGDTNKYVTFAVQPVHQLLTAYQQNPEVFDDDLGIPESGNGVPDVVDEVNWEIAWLRRMQFPDGSAALKVGEIVDTSGGRPGLDKAPRYYVPSCTSATIALAGMFAHAALVYQDIASLQKDSGELRDRAVRAWDNYQHTPKQVHCDTGIVRAGNADWSEADQTSAAVVAAVYLYSLTGLPAYADFVQGHYRESRPFRDLGWSRYNSEQGEALLYYASMPSADQATKAALLAAKAQDVRAAPRIYGFHQADDLYRAYLDDAQYHWGSNNPRANYGNSNMDVLTHHIATDNEQDYRQRAVEILHYFHGVNPFSMVYLSNMYAYGATRSVNEIYHTWFWHGSKWSDALSSECGPAPGFVPGGPNAGAARSGVPSWLVPPVGQPLQKSYRDWNAPWPEDSWTVTEPGIYYQSAYIALLSKFAR